MRAVLLTVGLCLAVAGGAWAGPSDAPSPRPSRTVSAKPVVGHKARLKKLGYKNPAVAPKQKRLVPKGRPNYLPGNTNDSTILSHPP